MQYLHGQSVGRAQAFPENSLMKPDRLQQPLGWTGRLLAQLGQTTLPPLRIKVDL
jgi:hypothetical protein